MNEKKYNFVYLTTNLINDKKYIGDHSTNDLDCWKTKTYLGSGKLITKKTKEYTKKNFKKEILEFFPTKQEAFDAQEKYIIQYNTLVPNGYNISPKGGRGCKEWIKHSDETKRKIGEANKISLKGMIRSEESKQKQSQTNMGHLTSNETREKLRIANLGEKNPMFGKQLSEESKQRQSNSLKGHIVSEETREKLRKANSGKKQSEEAKENNRQAQLKRSELKRKTLPTI
jgi:group I intron endonuclease